MDQRTWKIVVVYDIIERVNFMCYKDNRQKDDIIKLDSLFFERDKITGKIINVLVSQFIQKYFLYLGSSKSKLSYFGTIKSFLEWLYTQNIINNTISTLHPEDLKSVQDDHLINYLDGSILGIYGKKIKVETANTKMNHIRSFWSYLVEKDYVDKQIVNKKVSNKYKTKKTNEVEVPTDEEIEELLSNIENIKSEIIAIRNIAIVKLFIGSGIRLEELVGLDVNDLHFDCEKPYISIMEKGEKYNKVNVRVINKDAIGAVNDYLKVRNSNPNMKDLTPLFLSERMDGEGSNKRISVVTVQKFIDTYSNEKIHPHMLRHYAGTMAYNETKDIVWVSKWLRHGDVKVTTTYYVKANEDNVDKILNRL